MSPEKIIMDAGVAPMAMAVLIKAKDFVVTKGMVIVITASMALGGAAYKLDDTQKQLTAMSAQMKEIQGYMLTMQKDMYSLQQTVALTNNDINHIKEDMKSLTAQVGEMISDRVKIRE